MTHSLDFGPEAAINTRIAELRGLQRPRKRINNDQPLVPGVFFNSDPGGRVSIEAECLPDNLVRAHIAVDGPAQWVGMHIALGDLNLENRLLLGVAIRSRSPKSTSFRACLRTGQAEGFTDTFFRKTVVTYEEPSLHLDALMVSEHAGIAGPAPWRDLILFFRPETATVNLQDLRVFIL